MAVRDERDDEPVLRTSGLSVRYGGQLVVSDVDLEVGSGELVGLIGANGAGKTTTIDAVSGFVDHRGSVRLDGREVNGLRPHERARAGIGRTWQGIELFDDLTVRQNCVVAARRSGPATADRALDVTGLSSFADRRPNELSHGQQKLVGVARALAGAPRVLLLDEPAAGLDRTESTAFGSTLRRVVDESDIGALLVDHDTRLIFDVCDRVYVLDVGSIVSSGAAAEVRNDPAVIEAYLGVAT